jgi:hypothetical protein
MKNNFINSGSGKTIKIEITRTGKSNKLIDSKRNALNPGKRISKNGNTYYEKRISRSDLPNSKI